MSNRINTICVGLGCLETFHLFFPPCARQVPKLLSALFSCSTPTLSHLIPPLPFLSLFLSCCVALDFATILHLLLRWCSQRPIPPQSLHWLLCRRSLCTCSSAAGARRGRCCRSLYTCSSHAGARRCRRRRSLCTCSSAAGARRGCCHRSLYIGSSHTGARRCCCHRSLYTCSSAAGARRGRCRHSLCTCSSPAGARRCRRCHSLYTCSSALALSLSLYLTLRVFTTKMQSCQASRLLP